MRILWILSNRREGFVNFDRKREEVDSFQKHKDSMKKFRQAHPKVDTARTKEVVKTTKSANIRRADLVGIIPLPKIQLYRYVQN